MNHFSLELLPSNTLPYSPSSETTSANESRFDTTTSPIHHHMFEKLLTPSDVGKLNRLVIPKQNAEKYFPLAGDGIFLGFEDDSGKTWRFKYSYWNSSQSYVLTKGWTRYVKDNKLLAGDFVLFYGNRFESDRFFIGWRRRGMPPSPVFNQADTEIRQQMMSQKAVRVNPKRLRLFGVTLECELEDTEPQTSDNSTLSSQGLGSGSIQNSGSGLAPMSYNYLDYPQ